MDDRKRASGEPLMTLESRWDYDPRSPLKYPIKGHILEEISFFYNFIFLRFIYLFMRSTEREKERGEREGREREAEGEASSIQGARCGTRSRVSRITPWAEGRR